jgi:hypothetical protein
MAAIDRRHGSKGSVECDPAGGALAVPVASLNKWSLSMKREKTDITCFLDPNRIWAMGLMDVSGALSGMWDKADRTLFKVASGSVAAFLKLTPSTLDPTYLFSGLAYMDASIDVAVDGAVTIAGDYVAAGPWTIAPAPVVE